MVEVEKIEREREEGLKRLVVEWLATGVSRRAPGTLSSQQDGMKRPQTDLLAK